MPPAEAADIGARGGWPATGLERSHRRWVNGRPLTWVAIRRQRWLDYVSLSLCLMTTPNPTRLTPSWKQPRRHLPRWYRSCDQRGADRAHRIGKRWRLVRNPVGWPCRFQVQFAKLFATDTYAAAKDLVRRLRESRSGDLRVSDGSVYALIEPDLPDDALLQLAEPLPPAPSGALHYDRATGAWTDSG